MAITIKSIAIVGRCVYAWCVADLGIGDMACQLSTEGQVEPDEEDVQEPAEAEPEPVPSGLARFVMG